MAVAYMFTKGGYEGCSFGEKIYLSRAQAEKELRLYQLDKNSYYYNHPSDEFPWDVEEFELDETVPEIKITKNKPYRLNFEYAGLHYSIQDAGEFGEEYTRMTCKEDKDFCIILCSESSRTSTILWSHPVNGKMKPGQTYKQTDMSKLRYIINKYIEVR